MFHDRFLNEKFCCVHLNSFAYFFLRRLFNAACIFCQLICFWLERRCALLFSDLNE